MKKILICAAAMAAALAFAAPASAQGRMGEERMGEVHMGGRHMGERHMSERHHGRAYAYGHRHKVRYVMPIRSNHGGVMRGHVRVRHVHDMNRTRMMHD